MDASEEALRAVKRLLKRHGIKLSARELGHIVRRCLDKENFDLYVTGNCVLVVKR